MFFLEKESSTKKRYNAESAIADDAVATESIIW